MPLRDHLPAGVKHALRRAAAPLGSVDRVRTPEPEIVLTFDDGPDPVGTPAVLEALAAHGATATFFVLLTRVRRHPDLLARVLAGGHEIGLHGIDHQRLTRFTQAQVLTRTAAGKAELEAAAGTSVRWFRPPHGALDLGAWLGVRRTGLVPVLWGPTTSDWRDLPQEERVRRSLQGASRGAVVLAHDAFAGAEDGEEDDGQGLQPPDLDRRHLIDQVITAYAANGLRTCSLGHALRHGTAVRSARFRT